MHIQVVNFNLKDMIDEEFRKMCDELAPNFASQASSPRPGWQTMPRTLTEASIHGVTEVRTRLSPGRNSSRLSANTPISPISSPGILVCWKGLPGLPTDS